MKTKTIITIMILTVFVMTACSDSSTDSVNLKFTTASSALSVDVGNGVIITDFQIAIKKVEFKDDTSGLSNLVFEGPYILDLLSSAGPISQTIGTANIPAGTYKEIKFNLHKTTDSSTVTLATDHPLYDRSLFIAGTINGTNFQMYHDPSEDIIVTDSNGIVISQDSVANIVVRFNLGSIISNDSVVLDLTTATDDNGDSLIDISPNSPDGSVNKSLADDMKNSVKAISDFYKED